jgi:hypothetical protein
VIFQEVDGRRNRARTCDPLIKSQLVFETNQQLSKTKAVKPASNGPWLSSDLSNRLGMLRWVILIVAVAMLALFASVESSRADLHYESCVYQKLDSAILVVKSTENWV